MTERTRRPGTENTFDIVGQSKVGSEKRAKTFGDHERNSKMPTTDPEDPKIKEKEKE